MPALVSPALVSPGLSSTSSPARVRQAEEPQGRSFHAALDRSRASQADTEPTDGATARPGTPRRGASLAKDDALPQIPNLDFFVPAVSAQVTTAAARTGAEAVTAAALRGAATATKGTDVQAALAGTDTVADAAKAVTEADLPTAEAAATAAVADGAPADAATAEALRAAAGKTSMAVAAQADAAAATAKADAAAVPATPVTPSLVNAALASTVPAAPAPAARTGRTDAASRDTATTAAAATGTAEADPLDVLAARIEAATGNDAGLADDSAPTTPLAWMAAQPGSAGIGNGAATTDNRVPVLSLAPPVDSDAWAPALGQQMLRMSASGMHTAQLNLNPENLGPLQITLKLGDDQAQAMFVSGHESVRKAVEAALPQLRTTLAEHGISLGQTAVGADTRQPGSQSSFAGDNPSGRSGSNGGSSYPGAARNSTPASTPVPGAAVRSTRAEGVVDTFA